MERAAGSWPVRGGVCGNPCIVQRASVAPCQQGHRSPSSALQHVPPRGPLQPAANETTLVLSFAKEHHVAGLRVLTVTALNVPASACVALHI